jgi:hypothetical protein
MIAVDQHVLSINAVEKTSFFRMARMVLIRLNASPVGRPQFPADILIEISAEVYIDDLKAPADSHHRLSPLDKVPQAVKIQLIQLITYPVAAPVLPPVA